VLLALHHVPGFPQSIDLRFNYWLVVWAAAIVLAVVAAVRSSRRWALAALLPLANFAMIVVLIGLSEPRGH
jgi:glucan phosphoethanolaminetransferase (alkaline phosphatase superfamily)